MRADAALSTDEFVARLARREETGEIQAFNDANPEYWLLTHGHPPPPNDAQRAFEVHPPADMSYREDLWFLLRAAASEEIVGQFACATDLMAAGVYHLGFFIVATRLHGTGFAQRAYQSCEAWADARGARWLRLGVVEANPRAHTFWRRQGYVEVRRREGFALGDHSHVLITMVKPLHANTLAQYLDAVPRDRAAT